MFKALKTASLKGMAEVLQTNKKGRLACNRGLHPKDSLSFQKAHLHPGGDMVFSLPHHPLPCKPSALKIHGEAEGQALLSERLTEYI